MTTTEIARALDAVRLLTTTIQAHTHIDGDDITETAINTVQRAACFLAPEEQDCFEDIKLADEAWSTLLALERAVIVLVETLYQGRGDHLTMLGPNIIAACEEWLHDADTYADVASRR
jgi:hypothetical protein